MYTVEYINCKVCGNDFPKFLGIRGNKEYIGAADSQDLQEHIVTNVVRCRKCSFVYTNPFIHSNINAYDSPSDYLASSSAIPELLFGSILDLIERYKLKGKVLDVGCGKGEFLSVAQKRGWETYGVEPSEKLAKFSLDKYGLNNIFNSLEVAKYPDGFFDLITLNMVLEHVDDPKGLLNNINKLLNNSGVIFIEVPNTDSLMLKAAILYFRMRGKNWSPLLSPLHWPFHSYGYNMKSIRYLLDSRGFRLKRIFIRDSYLRGFRPDAGGTNFEKFFRNFITRFGGFVGKGDVLMVIAQKKESVRK